MKNKIQKIQNNLIDILHQNEGELINKQLIHELNDSINKLKIVIDNL